MGGKKTPEIKIRVDPTELTPYLSADWQLIPLHNYDYFTTDKKGRSQARGKTPVANNWTTRPYKNAAQVVDMKKKNNNVGVRLRAKDIVIDVDPRNFIDLENGDKDDPFGRLCADCGMDLSACFKVMTGGKGGGFHIYLKKPADVPVQDSLEDYEGVEFKSVGRQVVAAGSIHPETKKLYRWDDWTDDLSDVKDIPIRLLNLIRRPTINIGGSQGGEHTQEELTTMLDALDPEDFSDHERWLTIMQACHHATGGDGRQEFVNWSVGDPSYTGHESIIGRRWDSLHADSDGPRVTHRTLHKFMIDAGQQSTIPRSAAEDDFEMVGEEELPYEVVEKKKDTPKHERKSPLDRMNDVYFAVMDGGKFRIMYEIDNPTARPRRKQWVRTSLKDFESLLENRRIEKGDTTAQIAEEWMKWGKRRTAKGVIFDPEHEHEGFLNLWQGWGVKPRKGGSWSLLKRLLFENICDKDEVVYKYILNWTAYMVQHPGSPAEVAICLQGEKGVGKGTWGRAVLALAGRHGWHLTSSLELTGRFNGHLQDTIFVFADEAVKAHDKTAEGRLKGLITEPSMSFEGKGRDLVQGRNMIHLMMCSNDDWVVPAGLDGERRFLITRANSRRSGDMKFFKALNKQMTEGGHEALLFDMVHWDLGDWAPRDSVPITASLIDNKIRTMGPIQQWWFNILQSGILPAEPTRDDMDWKEGAVRLFHQDLKDSYFQHCREAGIRNAGGMSRSIDMNFAKEWKKMVPKLITRGIKEPTDERLDIVPHTDGRARAYEIPSLEDCRENMVELLGGDIDWG